MQSVKHMKWWAYKILPLSYDDSLSYYETISKVADKLNEVVTFLNNYTTLNNIEYAGMWDITKSYKQFRIVQTENGDGFLSIKPVPSYVEIDDKDYWIQIAQYKELYQAFGNRIKKVELSLPVYDRPKSNIIFGGRITNPYEPQHYAHIGEYHVYDANNESIKIKKI